MQKRTIHEMKDLRTWEEALEIVDFAEADDDELNSFEQAAENAYDEQKIANNDWFEE